MVLLVKDFDDGSMETQSHFFDRELSWLEFNQRVLNEALNEDVPLLERLKFLAITGSNLDEFFRVRIGAMIRLIESRDVRKAPSGLSVDEQFVAARVRIDRMLTDIYRCYLDDLAPQLEQAGLNRVTAETMTSAQKKMLQHLVESEFTSILSPMAVEADGRFPLLPNQMLNVCVSLAPLSIEARQNELFPREQDSDEATSRFAVIPLGHVLNRFISLPSDSGLAYIHLEDAVAISIQNFFPNEEIQEVVPFRLTRNAEVAVEELTPHGLAWNMADVLAARTQADCVRVEVADFASAEMTSFLQSQLNVSKEQMDLLPGPLDLGAFMELATRRGFESLQYESWPSIDSPDIPAEELIFDVLAERDVLLYHPYESFEPVVRFVEEAADDPDVIAIKQTLYRISRNSPIVSALKRAVSNGKHVTVLLELKARFDEERNLNQARELEAIGVQVILGVKGLKTHAKVCIVVRREPHGIQRYVHFGTGNYNESTAKIYSDASLLTSNEDLGADAVAFFNAISGYSQPPLNYSKLEAAPLRLRESVKEMIEAETERAASGQKARIMVKLNAVTDPELIESLYQASAAGVEIQMNIRGICCLKPGVPELSENIRVTSIIDRYLEHARILYFHHGGEPRVFISSADWMQRNLDHRKELLVPVEDEACRDRLISTMELYFDDNVKASELQTDGTYKRVSAKKEKPCRSQEELYRQTSEAVAFTRQRRRTMFEPHRPE